MAARPSGYRRPASAADRARAADRRADKLAAMHSQLHDGIAALRSGEDWRRWLQVARRFPTYSAHNVMLIAVQRPDATRVCGYEGWRALGRQVRKGEKGIAILAPVLRADRDQDRAAGARGVPAADLGAETASARRVAGFRPAHVFDVSQTDGDDLPEQPAAQLLAGAAPDGLWDALAALAAARGFTVERGECGDANGYTHFGNRLIRVRADVDPAQAGKTLAHELGHALIHDPAAFAGTTAGCRGSVEVEAESVAYLVAGDAGLDAAAYSFPYVAHWASGVDGRRPEQVVAATADRVLHAARIIVDSWQPAAAATTAAAALTAGCAQAGVDRSREAGRAAAALQRAATALARDQATSAATQRGDREQGLRAVCAAAAAFYTDQLAGSFVPGYLGGRGLAAVLSPDAPYLIGYAPAGWTGLVNHLRGEGHDDAAIVAAGLVLQTRRGRLVDRFRDRMMLPVRAEDGAIVAFIGRANPDTARGDTPKYLNCPETAIYRKGDVLFGLAEARAALGGPHRPVLVEGALDALAVWVATQGTVPVVAPSGTALTGGQVDALTRHVAVRERGIVVAFDADLGGRLGATRAFEALRAVTDRVLAADLPAGLDPAGLHEQEGPHRLAAAVSAAEQLHPLADDVVAVRLDQSGIDHTDFLERRHAALRHLAPLVAGLAPDDIGRQVVTVAQRLNLGFDTVTAAVADAISPPEDPWGRVAARDRRADLAGTVAHEATGRLDDAPPRPEPVNAANAPVRAVVPTADGPVTVEYGGLLTSSDGRVPGRAIRIDGTALGYRFADGQVSPEDTSAGRYLAEEGVPPPPVDQLTRFLQAEIHAGLTLNAAGYAELPDRSRDALTLEVRHVMAGRFDPELIAGAVGQVIAAAADEYGLDDGRADAFAVRTYAAELAGRWPASQPGRAAQRVEPLLVLDPSHPWARTHATMCAAHGSDYERLPAAKKRALLAGAISRLRRERADGPDLTTADAAVQLARPAGGLARVAGRLQRASHANLVDLPAVPAVRFPHPLDGFPGALRGHADRQLAAGPGGRAWKAAYGARFDNLSPLHRAALIAGAEHGGVHDIDQHVRGVAADLTRQGRELGEHAVDLPRATLRAGEARWAQAVEHAVEQAVTPGGRGADMAGGLVERGARSAGRTAHEGPSDLLGHLDDGPGELFTRSGDDDLAL